jgi:hypothetical protein
VIVGVMLVRNEADIIRTNLLYHLASGIDQVLVVDNGSFDGTFEILEELATAGRVHVFSRPGAFLQSAMTIELAREAFLRGADWVVPIDADEFWHVPNGRLRDVLDAAAGAGILEAEVVNFVQDRRQHELSPRALLTMTRRVLAPVGASGEADVLVESGQIGFVEICYPPKCVSRGSIALQIAQGNHSATGTYGPPRATGAIRCLHAPLRARALLERQKVEPRRPADEIADYLRHTWQLRRWRRLAAEGGLDAEWRANSYAEDCLDVYGERHPLVIDTTLRDLVAPWIEASAVAHAGGRRVVRDGAVPGPGFDAAAATAILDRMEQIEGWFRRDEGELLLQTTRRAIAGQTAPTIVEVGSYCGKSTIVIAGAVKASNPAARVYAIDPHEGEVGAHDTLEGVRREGSTFERFQANVAAAGAADVVVAIRQRSYDVSWTDPIAFLLVDGLHDYENVARDFRHFEPFLGERAFVAFHDCDDNYPGVRAFVAGLTGEPGYEEVGRASHLIVFRKRATSSGTGGAEPADPANALRVRVAQQQKGIAFLLGEIAAREKTIEEREAGIEWLRSVVRDKEATIAELEKGVEWLRKEVRERDSRIVALQAALGAEPERTGRRDAAAVMRMRSHAIALRRRAAPAILTAVALGAVVASLAQFASQPQFRTDGRVLLRAAIDRVNWSTDNDRRFADLKRVLPSSGTVGYINETRHHPGELETAGAYYQAQYALAPIGVEGSAPVAPSRHEYVVGDFRGPVDLAEISATLGVTVVQDFGNGLVLFRRAGAQP